MKPTLTLLKKKQLVWSASNQTAKNENNSSASTGFAELDAVLGNGFPTQGVMCVDSHLGIGELRLLLPHIQNLQQESAHRLLVFIAPPVPINSELLAEQGFLLDQVLVMQPESSQQALWAAEQCLKSGCCNAVILWQQALEQHQVKRLQLAAKAGDTLQIILRKQQGALGNLPVSLAMQLTSASEGVQVKVTKRKGGWPSEPFVVSMRQRWPRLTTKGSEQTNITLPARRVS